MVEKLRAVKMLVADDGSAKLICVYNRDGKRVVKALVKAKGQKIRDVLAAAEEPAPQ